jgi:flagellar hook-associated protein 3 FlgL
MTILTAAHQQFVTEVNQLQAALTKVQGEASSGIAVTHASDAPDQISIILQLHANIKQNSRIQDNLTNVQSTVNTADQTLSTATSIMDQVETLATQGLGMNTSASNRLTFANQVSGLLQQMVTLSNTEAAGQYIFSGDNDQSPSYQYNANSPTGVDRLQLSTSTREVQDGSGGSFPVGLTANVIFDARDSADAPTGNNIFKAINDVRVALLNNDTTALQTAQGNIQTAASYLYQQQAFYGNVENRISVSLTTVGNTGVALQTDLANRIDADETAAIVQMQQYTTALQAAIAAESKIPTTTLFDAMR